MGDADNVATEAVSGGVGSVLGGGKFANGARTGAFGYLFNSVGQVRCSGNCQATPEGLAAYFGGFAAVLAAPEILAGALVYDGLAGVSDAVAGTNLRQIALNKLAGDAFRDEVAGLLQSAGRDVQTEVYKWTPYGARYIDIEVSNGDEVLGGIETKVGSSPYTSLQQLKDWWLGTQGYTVNLVRGP